MGYSLHAADAVKIALALAIGLLIGFEREWSNKEAGIRTCAAVALAGALTALVSVALSVAALAGVVVLMVFVNLRALRASGVAEITTSAALLLVYVLGVLVGHGNYFAPVVAAIVITLLLAWKPELHRFAGEVRTSEVHGAIWLALLAFVIYPLLPNRPLDPWGLVNLHTLWVAVIVVAAVGFVNYVLMRLYSARGLYYSAVLGGLVSTTATILELGVSLRRLAGELPGAVAAMSVTITLLASLAMFGRNLVLLAIFSPAGVARAWVPLLAMGIAGVALIRRRRVAAVPAEPLHLESPISLRRVAAFGGVFLAIQIATTLAERHWGQGGTYVIAVLGGLVNSASAVAAVGELAAQHTLPPLVAGVATVLASMASATVNSPLMNRALGRERSRWDNHLLTGIVVAIGAIALALQALPH
jgi:uncharacterized membrane protein (DUF4010 family)